MRLLGVDLAAEAAKTGAVVIAPIAPDRWEAFELDGPSDDDRLVLAARDVDVIGIDSPLGWPVAFVEAVAAHDKFQPWPGTRDRSTLIYRDTDRALRRLGFKAPLSVSADKLGSVAMRCALLQRRWAEEVWTSAAPRDGSGPLVETYPAAAFSAWKIECGGYKSRDRPAEAPLTRESIVNTIESALAAWLDLARVRQRCIASDHVLDALACALVTIASKTAATHQPADDERPTALVEGWMHVPSQSLSELRPPQHQN